MMGRLFLLKTSIFLILALPLACKHPALRENPFTVSCDTLQVSYSCLVVPVLREYCYACHSTAVTASQGGLDLEDFGSLKNYLHNYYHNDSIYGSKFIHIIQESVGVSPMPPSGRLPGSDIRCLTRWIQEGAPQN